MDKPIGVFDSGLGGLTVLKEIMKIVPGENVVYLGDNGRAPYGTKSKETIIKYTFQNIRFLLEQDVKMLVIACNTSSACSYELVKNGFDVPVVEVVRPGAMTVARETRNKKVGVIGTLATINSGVYEKAINMIDSSIRIVSKACPLFVPLAEEGWWENDIALRVAKEYLNPLNEEGIDTLIMGCTHYPLLQNTIERVMGEGVKLVNSALEVAKAVKEAIIENNIEKRNKQKPFYKYYTTDSIERFEMFGSSILGREINSTMKADIEKY